MKLKDALELYKKEERTPSNSYEWYRKSAQRNGTVSIGDTNVPAYKLRGVWYVDGKRFAEAIKQHREKIKHLKQVTTDYSKGIIHGKDGDVVYTESGGYKIRGEFRFVWSDYEQARKRSSGTWYCNKCNILAETEHNKEECHLCSD
jgi:TPR repeat protein